MTSHFCEILSPQSSCKCSCTTDESENFAISSLAHYYVIVPRAREELKILYGYLLSLIYRQAVIYVRDSQRCAFLTEFLCDRGFSVTCVHPFLPLNLRIQRYRYFLGGSRNVKILVTSCCGHAMEITEEVDVAFNFDEADSEVVYCHRVSNRKNTKGLVMSFIRENKFVSVLKNIEKLQNVKVEAAPKNIPIAAYSANEEIS